VHIVPHEWYTVSMKFQITFVKMNEDSGDEDDGSDMFVLESEFNYIDIEKSFRGECFHSNLSEIISSFEDDTKICVDSSGDDDVYELNFPDGAFPDEVSRLAKKAQSLMKKIEKSLKPWRDKVPAIEKEKEK